LAERLIEGVSTTAPARGDAPLLERDAELTRLGELIAAARAGDARLVLVEGPAGIGKSRLLAELKRDAAGAGMRVLAARASELEREFPFGVVRQIFEPAVASGIRSHYFDGAAAAAGSVFARVTVVDADHDGSFASLHGLYWLTANLAAEGPLVIAVDDLHWCDRSSLRFLAYLARRLEGLPLLVVASLRPAEPGADVALIAELAQDPLTLSVLPGPLSRASAEELLRERLGATPDPAFAAAIHRTTGGNPLFLHELLRALEAEGVAPTAEHVDVVDELGPRAASRSVFLRLGRLQAEAIAVASAAAVLGDGADIGHVAALAGVDGAAAAAATGQLARAEILRAEAPLAFVHPLVRAAIYRDVPPGERQLRHARAARLLADAGAPAEEVAAHMLAMPRQGDEWVVETLAAAAHVAAGRGAPDGAVVYLRRALEEPPAQERRVGLLLELGVAEWLTDGPAAAEHLQAAYRALEDPVERAQIAAMLVTVLGFTGRSREARALADEATARLGPEHDDLRWLIESDRLTQLHFDLGACSIHDPAFTAHRGELAGPGIGARSIATAAAYQWAMTGGSADDCADLVRRATADGTLMAAAHASGPAMGAIIVVALADRDEAVQLCDEVLASAFRRGSIFEASGGHLFKGFALLLRGELAEAERLLREAARLTDEWGSTAVRLYPAAYLADTLVERGDLEGARAALAEAQVPPDAPVATNLAWWYAARLRLAAAAGEWRTVLELADEVESLFADVIANPGWVPWRSLRAEALHALGRPEEARAQAQLEVEPARRWGAPRVLGRALRVLGVVSGAEGLPHLEEAVSVLEGSPARLEHAKALAALGTALRLDRRPSEAREPLREALELAAVCGAEPLVERVRAELYAAGARPRTGALSGVAALTPSELRVASLAAEGQTNRDIAQALFVTPKTVELHLSNAYRKLRIRSRRDLATALST
jgi:DNA-binding CsgD family transcriptional regulator